MDGIKGNSFDDKFFPVSVTDLIEIKKIKSEQIDYQYFGPFIQISFHSDFENLLQEFYGTTRFGDDTFEGGGLILQPNFDNDTIAQSNIASMLGILPEHTKDPELGFVLMRYWKSIRTQEAKVSAVNRNYLEEFMNIDRNEPDIILNMFSKYGTHFVSKYTEGDFIYQVFVYLKEDYDEVEEEFPDDPDYLFGIYGILFRKYTKIKTILPDGQVTGYSHYVGDILAASKDPVLSNIVPLLYDNVYRVYSLLMFLTDSAIFDETKEMETVVPTIIELSSVSKRVYTRRLMPSKSQAWDSVLKASIYQKFGSLSSPGLQSVGEEAVIEYYSSFNPDLVTSTATSYTAIVQDTFDLTELKIINPDYVTDLFIFADILQLQNSAKAFLPATNTIYLICREFISNSSGSTVPEISVGNGNSVPEIKLIASSFKGTLKITYNSNIQSHITVSDGTVFETVVNEDGNFTVISNPNFHLELPIPSVVPELYVVDPLEYREIWLANSYLNGLQLLAITIETVYSLLVEDSIEAAKESLNWMIMTLETAKNETNINDDLEIVLSRLLALKKLYPDPSEPILLVPTLTYPQYKASYDLYLDSVDAYETKLSEISQEISTRLQTEDIIDSLQELSENILEIGKFLVGMVQADAEYYEDVKNMFDSMRKQKEDELEEENKKAAELFDEVIEYTELTITEGQELVNQVKLNGILTIISTVTKIVAGIGTMFTSGVGVAKIPSEIVGIKRVAEKVSYFVKIAEQLAAMYDLGKDLATAIAQINNELLNTPDMTKYLPSQMDWNDFDTDVATYTSPSYLGCCSRQGAKYKNAAGKLSTRGKAYLDTLSKVSSLEYEIVLINMKEMVMERQTERLKKLMETMNQESLDEYQTNTTDLYELGNILQTQANSVKIELARVYLTMDAALQYYYLKPPTPLNGYNTLEIKKAAATQASDAIDALNKFPAKPHNLEDPIVYKIPQVRVLALTSKQGYKFRIPLNSKEFEDYIRVRIREIRVTIDSIKSADKDGIYIQCNYTGLNFEDRGLNREDKKYNTMSTEYRYVYNYTNNELIVGNSVSPDLEDVYAMMTPFAEWVCAIPDLKSSNTNVNITYSSLTTTLKIEFYINIIFDPPLSDRLMKSEACDSNPKDTPCLLDRIYRQTVTGEWDAVMTMDAQRVNELWKDKYDYQVEHGGLAYNISTDYFVVMDIENVILIEARLAGIVNSPLIQFIENNPDTLKMTMKMHDAVYETLTTYPNGMSIPNATHYDQEITITSLNSISILQGSVSNTKVVAVDFEGSVIDITIQGLEEVEELAIESALVEYFQSNINSSAYDLGTIDFDSAVTPPAFQPRSFLFTTGAFDSSPGGLGTLYICIVTHSSRNTNPTTCNIRVLNKDTDAIIPNGYNAALYLSSQVLFEDLIKPAFEDQFGNGAGVSKYDEGNDPAYRLICKDQTISYNVKYSMYACHDPEVYFDYPFEIPAGEDFAIESVRPGSLLIRWDVDWEYDILVEKTYWAGTCYHQTITAKDVNFYLTVSQQQKPTVDENEIVTIPPFNFDNSQVSFDEWTNAMYVNDAADLCCKSIRNRVSNLHISINSFSVFALTNLIFPNAKVISMTEVFFPGDMLILGNITRSYNPEGLL